MSTEIRAHLNELKSLVLSHPRVYGVSIRREEVTVARGCFRFRLLLPASGCRRGVGRFTWLREAV